VTGELRGGIAALIDRALVAFVAGCGTAAALAHGGRRIADLVVAAGHTLCLAVLHPAVVGVTVYPRVAGRSVGAGEAVRFATRGRASVLVWLPWITDGIVGAMVSRLA
jgi:hypothetical protein